jgi:non-heme chloroperoxidase
MPTLSTFDATLIDFRDSGAGRPYVFVHGWTLNQEMWDYHVHHLSAMFRCVTYDRRGHGRSGVPNTGYDVDRLADDLAALLDHLDLVDITLVSHSVGSGDVVRYLTRHGSRRVRNVVMIAPGSPMAGWAQDNPTGRTAEQIRAAMDDLADDRANWFTSRRDAYFALPAEAARTSKAMVEATVRQCLQTPLTVQLAGLRTMLTTDLRPDFAAMEVPTTIIHGALDQNTPLASCGIPAAGLLPRGELRVYDDAAHGIYLSHRREVAAELRRAADALEPMS